MYQQIGAYDTETKFSSILQQSEQGKSIVDLVPHKNTLKDDLQTAIVEMQNIDKIEGISTKTLLSWIKEGH